MANYESVIMRDQRGDLTVVRIRGEIDMLAAPQLRQALAESVDHGQGRVVIDAHEVTFIDASGIRALIDGYAAFEQNGSRILIVPSPPLQRLIDVLELNECFETLASQDGLFPSPDENPTTIVENRAAARPEGLEPPTS